MLNEKARPSRQASGRAAEQGAAAVASSRQLHHTTSEVFRNGRGRVVGRLAGGWLRKHVDTARHQLRQPPAWAIDREHLERMEALGAAGVLLIDETGTEWRATVSAFRQLGIAIERGHGRQIALPLARWERRRPGEPAAEQLGLWGGVR